jgi:peptidoglycan/LPS O-acetylase OafA/YrhL
VDGFDGSSLSSRGPGVRPGPATVERDVAQDPSGAVAPWTVRVAGAATILVGVVNAVAAVVATSVSGLSMQPLVAAGLAVAGAATAWLGWKIWGGTRWALHLAAGLFAVLLVAQVSFAEPEAAETGTSRVVLAVLVTALLVAVVHVRRRGHETPAG